MSLLRQRMIEDMQLHGYSARTQEAYVRAVRQLSDRVHHGPGKVTEEELILSPVTHRRISSLCKGVPVQCRMPSIM